MAATSNYIDFKEMSDETQEMILEEIIRVLKFAGKYEGKVFGGFVRNVLVPRSVNPKCPIDFKDVDIWFKNQENADAFVTEMGDRFRLFDPFTTTTDNTHYPFDRRQYHFFDKNVCLAWFDVVVADELPVDDFDVNCVTVCYLPTECWFNVDKPGMDFPPEADICDCGGKSPLSDCGTCYCVLEKHYEILRQRILAKEARLLKPIVDLFTEKEYWFKNNITQRPNILCHRFQRRYMDQGWKIFYGLKQCTPAQLKTSRHFRQWIMYTDSSDHSISQDQRLCKDTPSSPDPRLVKFDEHLATLRREFLSAIQQ